MKITNITYLGFYISHSKRQISVSLEDCKLHNRKYCILQWFHIILIFYNTTWVFLKGLPKRALNASQETTLPILLKNGILARVLVKCWKDIGLEERYGSIKRFSLYQVWCSNSGIYDNTVRANVKMSVTVNLKAYAKLLNYSVN